MSSITDSYYRIRDWILGIDASEQEAFDKARHKLDQMHSEEQLKLDKAKIDQEERHQKERKELEEELFQRNVDLERQRSKIQEEFQNRLSRCQEKMKSSPDNLEKEKDSEQIHKTTPCDTINSSIKNEPLGQTFSRPGTYGNEFGRNFGNDFANTKS